MVIEMISLLLTMAALKGMMGALAPFSYLVKKCLKQNDLQSKHDIKLEITKG